MAKQKDSDKTGASSPEEQAIDTADSMPTNPVIESPSSQWSVLWLLPFVALCFAVWIAWKAYTESSIVINVQFPDGRGLEAGKTQIMYNGLAVGYVKRVKMLNDLSGVDVVISMQYQMGPYINKKSAFWLVAPEVSLARISGLETLFSGNYIGFQPGKKGFPATKEFIAEKEPPAISEPGGLRLTLYARELGSFTAGSPVYYKKIKVGEVTEYALADIGDVVNINIFIKPEFAHLVTTNTKFWNASGIDISGSFTNFKVRTQSISSILNGGIALFTPSEDLKLPNGKDKKVEKGSRFELFSDFNHAQVGVDVALTFPVGAQITKNVTRIKFSGMDVGVVREVEIGESLKKIKIEAAIDPRIESALVEGAQFWVVEPEISLNGIKGLDTLLQGPYINMEVSESNIRNAVKKRSFQGLSQQPSGISSDHDLAIVLESTGLQDIDVGSPLLFRQIEIGRVAGYDLSADNKKVKLHLAVEEKYKKLLNRSSRFWNLSGFQIRGDMTGLTFNVGTLKTLIKGGIGVTTPDPLDVPISTGKAFELFDTREEALEQGINVQLIFPDAGGLEKGTPLVYKGVTAGKIKRVVLEQPEIKNKKVVSQSKVVANLLVKKQFEWLAHSGAKFWLVEPELGLAKVANLDTLFKGRYIAVQPASRPGRKKVRFKVLPSSGPEKELVGSGLHITLVSDQLNSIKKGNPVLFREIKVGEVIGYGLAHTSDYVEIFINIEPRYARLVQKGSRFWNSSGIDINFGLMSGATLRTDSVESLLSGGISFATPENSSPISKARYQFHLFNEPEAEWLKWKPVIKLN